MNVQILGMGGIGVYLAHALSKSGLSVVTYDERKKEDYYLYKAIIDGDTISMQLLNYLSVAKKCDFIIVALKSYDITDKIFTKLSESKKQVLFVQNGVSVCLRRRSEFGNFHFGTIYGIQAKKEIVIADIKTQNATLAIIPNQNDSILKHLEMVDLADILLLDPTDKSKIIYLEKFTRWLIASLVCSYYRKPLGLSLKSVKDVDLNSLIASIGSFLFAEFNFEVDTQRIRESLFRLPGDLITSATNDYLGGRDSELFSEVKFVISEMERRQLDVTILRYWSRFLQNV